jgi:hypothetical protein
MGVLLLVLLISPALASAQSEDFTIKLFGSTDIEAPTTPVLLDVAPLTTDQINVRWSTSTDNFAVFGYVVVRDGVGIATTTLTTYNDSGLSPSTTYSYEVIAFDGVPNYSTSSVAVATSTLAIPAPAPSSAVSTQSGTRIRVVLDSIDVTVGVATATMDVRVQRPARIEVRLGETSSYEKGYFAGSVYRRDHIVPINDLRANTTYYYEVVGYTLTGVQTVLEQGSFTTADNTPPSSPVNVVNFGVTLDGTAVRANWELPLGIPTDARVRVVRSHLGFPGALDDGVVVYEGRGVTALDESAFTAGDIAYYTAFVIDPNGLVSSGAVSLIRNSDDASLPGDFGNSSLGNNGDGTSIDTSSTTNNQVPPDPNMPQPQDIFVSQDGVTYSFASSTIPLAGDELFFVSIPANKIVGAFKTIVVTLDDPRGSGKNFSFLLRLNNTQTEYTATIAPVQIAGTSALLVDVYDYNAKVVGSYRTQLEFTKARGTSSSTFELLMWRLQILVWQLLAIVPILTLAGVWFIFWYRRNEDEDNQPSV